MGLLVISNGKARLGISLVMTLSLSNMKVPMVLFLVGSTEESWILIFWSMVQVLLSSRLWPRTIAAKMLRKQVRIFILCLACGFLS